MKNLKHGLHVLFLYAELATLLATVLYPIFRDEDGAALFHFHCAGVIVMIALGGAAIPMAFIIKIGTLRLDGATGRGISSLVLPGILAMGGAVLLIRGCSQACFEYPEVFQVGSGCQDAEDRLRSANGVLVLFDPSGGVCDDRIRVVRLGERYGCTMNVYPSDCGGYYLHLNYCRLNIPRGMMRLAVNNTSANLIDTHYLVTNAVVNVPSDEMWTYVVDIDRFTGSISDWFVGQSWKTNGNVFARLERGRVGPNVKSGEKKFLYLKNNPWPYYNYLDRGIILAAPGQAFEIFFRVSLFAGRSVDASNYRYVRPGETIECPLPVPAREGYAFEGWYDGDRRISEVSQVEKRETHTLKARWRKL